jgi:hypothetical protein
VLQRCSGLNGKPSGVVFLTWAVIDATATPAAVTAPNSLFGAIMVSTEHIAQILGIARRNSTVSIRRLGSPMCCVASPTIRPARLYELLPWH